MSDKHLTRRPTWYRFAIIIGMIFALYVASKIKDAQMGWNSGGIPFWSVLFVTALFTFAAMTEMSQTLSWNSRSIRMHPRWGFQYLGYRTLELSVDEITEISAGYMSNETLGEKPFSVIEVTDGITVIPIRANNFFREGMQELVADVARLRRDLELGDNLQAYLRGDFDDVWPT
jgi:hypothetical protein